MKLNLTLFVYLFCVRFHLFIRQKSVNSIKGSTDRECGGVAKRRGGRREGKGAVRCCCHKSELIRVK